MQIDLKENSVIIDGIEYEKKQPPLSDFCIIRTYSAGVFAGYVKEKRGHELDLTDVIRLHYWGGACSLSQLSQEGVKEPNVCRFSVVVPFQTVNGWIEIIPCTAAAEKNIKGVKTWKS